MKFRDLGAQYEALKPAIDSRIAGVIASNAFILGNEVKELEGKLAEYVGKKHCVTCGSGTDALVLPLMAWGIGKGDAVFVPDFTYFATACCAILRGATPVPVDIDYRTFNMSPSALEEAIKRVLKDGKLTPRVIIPVDLFGLPADFPEIRKIADKYSLKILEDGAQGFGGSINGKKDCSFGDIGATSFFPAKPLGCYGDGGAMFTDDDETDALLRSVRAMGRSPQDKYDNVNTGTNSRLDTIQAAILLPKLDAFREYELDEVNRVAKSYTEKLAGTGLVTPLIPEGYVSSWAQYTVHVKDEQERAALQAHLKSKDIPSMIYYPRSIHTQTAMQKLGYNGEFYPNSVKAAKTCLSLPMHPYLKEEDIAFIADAVTEFYK